jgi:hypothetical protein
VNLHNAEVTRYFFPEEGNAYYNAVRYDATPAKGDPSPGPSYYAMLLFARLAQGMSGLRPVTVENVPVKAWQLSGPRSERRLFLINKGSSPVTIDVEASQARVELDRMTPHDPTGAGRTLDAPDVRIDGRSLAANGEFPGLDPSVAETHGGRVPVTLVPGEAVVVTLHGHDE